MFVFLELFSYNNFMHKGELSRIGKGTILADIILGGQDGLVNVLGVILGIAVASEDIKIIIAGGMAATFAESISMAAVALTSKLTERDHYIAELEREKREIEEMPDKEEDEIMQAYKKKGFSGKILDDIVVHIKSDKTMWVNEMMKEELNLVKVSNREIYGGSTIVLVSALVGSFIPLVPFFFFSISASIIWSLVLSAFTLLLVGIYKAKTTIGHPVKSGIQMVLIGMGAALAGYLIGLIFS